MSMKRTGDRRADRVLEGLLGCYIDSKVAEATVALIRTLVAEQSGAGAVRRVVRMRSARRRRVYIAGPMTGLPELNFPLFNATAARLRSEHWHVENPAEHGNIKGAAWSDYLRYDLSRVVTCGAIYLLPGWSKSEGATLEVDVAKRLGLAIILADGAEAGETSPSAQDEKDAERFRSIWDAAKREDEVFYAAFHAVPCTPETLDEFRALVDSAVAASAKHGGAL